MGREAGASLSPCSSQGLGLSGNPMAQPNGTVNKAQCGRDLGNDPEHSFLAAANLLLCADL